MELEKVYLNKHLVDAAFRVGQSTERNTAEQIEHWTKIGRIMEDNPDLTYDFVRDVLDSKTKVDAGQFTEYKFD